MTLRIESKEKLCVENLANIPSDILEELSLNDYYVDNNYLNDQNFIKMSLLHNKEKYTLVHGFPEDNAHGIIYKHDDSKVIRINVGEECGKDDYNAREEFIQWYLTVTNDCMEFSPLLL